MAVALRPNEPVGVSTKAGEDQAGLRVGYILEDEVIGFGLAANVVYLQNDFSSYVPITLAGQILVTTW